MGPLLDLEVNASVLMDGFMGSWGDILKKMGTWGFLLGHIQVTLGLGQYHIPVNKPIINFPNNDL